MDVATISMPREQARVKLAEYRRGVHRRSDAEWERARVAYEALAEGTPLIILSQAITQAPRDEKGRPRLAIARADRQQIIYRSLRPWQFEQFDANRLNRWGYTSGRSWDSLVINVPHTAETPTPANVKGFALVPMVPPSIAIGHKLTDRYILWEVEAWSDTVIRATPDCDPYLLRRVADDLYAVVGAWELTAVEQAVMRDRARA